MRRSFTKQCQSVGHESTFEILPWAYKHFSSLWWYDWSARWNYQLGIWLTMWLMASHRSFRVARLVPLSSAFILLNSQKLKGIKIVVVQPPLTTPKDTISNHDSPWWQCSWGLKAPSLLCPTSIDLFNFGASESVGHFSQHSVPQPHILSDWMGSQQQHPWIIEVFQQSMETVCHPWPCLGFAEGLGRTLQFSHPVAHRCKRTVPCCPNLSWRERMISHCLIWSTPWTPFLTLVASRCHPERQRDHKQEQNFPEKMHILKDKLPTVSALLAPQYITFHYFKGRSAWSKTRFWWPGGWSVFLKPCMLEEKSLWIATGLVCCESQMKPNDIVFSASNSRRWTGTKGLFVEHWLFFWLKRIGSVLSPDPPETTTLRFHTSQVAHQPYVWSIIGSFCVETENVNMRRIIDWDSQKYDATVQRERTDKCTFEYE